MLSDSPQVVDNRALDQERPDQPRHRGAGDGDEDDDGLFSGGLSKLGLPLISFGEDASPNYKNVPLPGPSSKVQVQGRVQAWQETISQANAEGNKARPWFPENSNVDEKELLNAKVVTKRTVSGFSASAVDLSQTVTPDHAQGWDETRTVSKHSTIIIRCFLSAGQARNPSSNCSPCWTCRIWFRCVYDVTLDLTYFLCSRSSWRSTD